MKPGLHIVGITGYARAGKDTAADAFVLNGWTRAAFADPVKDLAVKIGRHLAVSPDPRTAASNYATVVLSQLLSGSTLEEAKDNEVYGRDVRRVLQDLGYGLRDVFSPTILQDTLMRRWRAGGYLPMVVPDVRIRSEADLIRRQGGTIIRINRPGHGPANTHETELGVDLIAADTTFENDSTVEALRELVANRLNLRSWKPSTRP